MSFIKHLECTKCNNIQDINMIQSSCYKCSSPLYVRYDLDSLRLNYTRSTFLNNDKLNSLWRYKKLLPVINDENIISLGEGMTPLLECKNLKEYYQLNSNQTLFIKDESQNPTSTFKSRGSSVSLSKAKELGIKEVVLCTNGNAGSSWSSYCARGRVPVTIYMPIDSTDLARDESILFGGNVKFVNGLINDCSLLASKHSKESIDGKCFDVSTLKEPYRLEGKKTIGLEIAEQLNFTLPDVIIYPTGGGVGLIAIYKAFQELQELGWLNPSSSSSSSIIKMPKFISVQAKGCCPLKLAYDSGSDHCEVFQNADTIAKGMRVPKSLGDFLILDIIRKTNGGFIVVDDNEIIETHKLIPSLEGIFLCTEASSAVLAIKKSKEIGLINDTDKTIVIINTGSGLKQQINIS